ncbi:Glucooligosaccharide oxidase [Mycena sanguinolenta]|uniref:Glucooligosaccharide oxidase n=1 Tax=Mycena sanguinolenta TaxID=230812 RepID=A0A8H7DC80_9AGAR|nr:Glucooligosaccharide oxidase [Mycena sanguinolenta]
MPNIIRHLRSFGYIQDSYIKGILASSLFPSASVYCKMLGPLSFLVLSPILLGAATLIQPSANSAKCLTAASNTDGAAVEIEDCVSGGSTSQNWTITEGTLQLFGTKCLDVTNGVTTNGNKMQIWTCATGNTNQMWTVSENTIQWTGHSICLDLTNGVTTNGNVMQIWTCTGGINQQWISTISTSNPSTLQQILAANGISALFPGNSGYATAAQAYNQRFTISPAAIAYPTTVQQVSEAVAAGTAQKMQAVARSGGHSYIANGLGGASGALVIDMSMMKAITVRSSNNTALIETGNRLGDIALALNNAGRAIPHGTSPYVGIGGHSGYGGFGFTSRAWGLTLDTIKSATVVLANGTIAAASSTVNPDLFWAIRGASPSFGIVTSIEVQTFAAPASATVFQYGWDSMDITTASNAIAALQTFAATNISAQFGAELVFAKGPSNSHVNVGLTGAWYGAANLFSSTIAPYLSTLPTPSWSTITPGSYINSVSILANSQPLNTSTATETRNTFYTKSLMTPSGSPMSSAAIEAFVTYMATQGFSSDTDWFVEVELYGGSNSAINAVPLDLTAFAKRDTLFTIQFYASSEDDLPPYPADGFSFLDGMVSSIISNSPVNWSYGAHLNYIDDMLGANASALYYGSHYARLQSIKAAMDPLDTFRFPVGVST